MFKYGCCTDSAINVKGRICKSPLCCLIHIEEFLGSKVVQAKNTADLQNLKFVVDNKIDAFVFELIWWNKSLCMVEWNFLLDDQKFPPS